MNKRGITCLFPIQAQSFDLLYEGKDMIGKARTGSGKTLAFALPLIEKLRGAPGTSLSYGRTPRLLVLTPTRELAKQVGEDFLSVSPRLSTLCVYGGVGTHPQKDELRKGVDVVVGTPGRVMDLMECNALKLASVKHVVLDEADRMLDMGFAEDVNKILSAVPGMAGFSAGAKAVQFILFSATIPDWVRQMSKKHMVDPSMIDLVQGQEASLDVRHLVSAAPPFCPLHKGCLAANPPLFKESF